MPSNEKKAHEAAAREHQRAVHDANNAGWRLQNGDTPECTTEAAVIRAHDTATLAADKSGDAWQASKDARGDAPETQAQRRAREDAETAAEASGVSGTLPMTPADYAEAAKAHEEARDSHYEAAEAAVPPPLPETPDEWATVARSFVATHLRYLLREVPNESAEQALTEAGHDTGPDYTATKEQEAAFVAAVLQVAEEVEVGPSVAATGAGLDREPPNRGETTVENANTRESARLRAKAEKATDPQERDVLFARADVEDAVAELRWLADDVEFEATPGDTPTEQADRVAGAFADEGGYSDVRDEVVSLFWYGVVLAATRQQTSPSSDDDGGTPCLELPYPGCGDEDCPVCGLG